MICSMIFWLPLRYPCARVSKRHDEDFWIIYYNFGSGFVSPKIAVYYKKLLKFRAVAIILNKDTLRFARYKNIQKSGYSILPLHIRSSLAA